MKSVINIKTDKEVKKSAQKAAEDLGLSLSAIVNAYLKEFIRDREVRFSMEPQIRPEVSKLLTRASADFKNGKNVAGPFKNAKAAIEYLHS
jgi:addiction module RelB/DinJ family antitoxin